MNKKHILAFVFFGALLALLIIHTPKKSGQPFLFGAILPLTGANSSSGVAGKAGIEMMKRDLEAATETTIDVRVLDSALLPEQGKTLAEVLIAENVSALYSSYTVVTREVSEVARQAETPLFYDSCNCGFAKENPYAFQLYVDPRKECREAAERSKKKGGTGAAFVGQDVPYAKYCIDEMTKVFGAENVTAEFDQTGIMKNYKALFESFSANHAAFVISLPITDHIREAIRAAGANEMSLLCFAAQCLTPEIIQDVSAEELASVIAFDFSITPEFEEAIRQEMPDVTHDAVVAAAVAHDALLYAYSAHTLCGDTSVRCISKTATKTLLPTAIVGNGFDRDRILNYETRYVRMQDSEIVATEF